MILITVSVISSLIPHTYKYILDFVFYSLNIQCQRCVTEATSLWHGEHLDSSSKTN